MSVRDVLIVGAGPAGLATAIAARHHGLDHLVVEQGSVADAVYRFPTHMVFVTTPERLEVGGVPFTTPYDKPTRAEALRYYRKVVEVFQLQLVLREQVTAVVPVGAGEERHFEVESRSARGLVRVRRARAVVLAMGYYGHPNMLGVPGEDLPHVSHYYREAHPYYRQRVVVVGGRDSACEAALDLCRSGVHVTIVHRGAALGDSFTHGVRPEVEDRIASGAIAARFSTEVVAIRPTEVEVRSPGAAQTETIPAEGVLLLTGYQADHAFLEAAGVILDPLTRVPQHDAATFETNVPNLFIAGGQLAGVRTGTIGIENGRVHGEQVARVLAGRLRGSQTVAR